MGNICSNGMLRRFILCAAATSFITSSIAAPLYAQNNNFDINLNEIAFIARMEKLYEKVIRYKDKLESGKLIDTMFEIKMEVEGYTGRKIDIDSHIDLIEKEAKKGGAKFKSGEMKQIRKMLKKSEKKHNHRAVYLYECNMYDVPFNEVEWEHQFKAASKHDKHEREDDKKEIKVPIRMTIGITASLCGYFLSFIPHPYCQGASKFLISTGVALCIDGTVNRLEENEKNEENQKNQGK